MQDALRVIELTCCSRPTHPRAGPGTTSRSGRSTRRPISTREAARCAEASSQGVLDLVDDVSELLTGLDASDEAERASLTSVP